MKWNFLSVSTLQWCRWSLGLDKLFRPLIIISDARRLALQLILLHILIYIIVARWNGNVVILSTFCRWLHRGIFRCSQWMIISWKWPLDSSTCIHRYMYCTIRSMQVFSRKCCIFRNGIIITSSVVNNICIELTLYSFITIWPTKSINATVNVIVLA